VELQLVRVETCGCAEGYARDGKQICVSLFNLCWINFPAAEVAGFILSIQRVAVYQAVLMCEGKWHESYLHLTEQVLQR
jgi:hypothetical protein